MALRGREELIGKRFMSVQCGPKLKISRICDWEWRSGVVRAVSNKDSSHPELAVRINTIKSYTDTSQEIRYIDMTVQCYC